MQSLSFTTNACYACKHAKFKVYRKCMLVAAPALCRLHAQPCTVTRRSSALTAMRAMGRARCTHQSSQDRFQICTTAPTTAGITNMLVNFVTSPSSSLTEG